MRFVLPLAGMNDEVRPRCSVGLLLGGVWLFFRPRADVDVDRVVERARDGYVRMPHDNERRREELRKLFGAPAHQRGGVDAWTTARQPDVKNAPNDEQTCD